MTADQEPIARPPSRQDANRRQEPAVVGGCSCGHPVVEHYATGCGWCICKISGPATDEAPASPPSPTFPNWLNMMPVEEVINLVRGGSTLAKEYVAYCDQVHRDAHKAAQNAPSEQSRP